VHYQIEIEYQNAYYAIYTAQLCAKNKLFKKYYKKIDRYEYILFICTQIKNVLHWEFGHTKLLFGPRVVDP